MKKVAPLSQFVRTAKIEQPHDEQVSRWPASASCGYIETRFLRVHFRSRGRLNRWMGPSLRGILAKPLKDFYCAWEATLRDSKFKHCEGCGHQCDCTYANLLEPTKAAASLSGRETPPQRLAIIPDYPARSSVDPSLAPYSLAIRLVLIDVAPVVVQRAIWQLGQGGRHQGLGNDKVRFELEEVDSPTSATFDLREAWRDVASWAELPNLETVRVGIATPTILKRDGELLIQPHLFDFVAAGLRVIRAALTLYRGDDQVLTVAQADTIKQLALTVGQGYQDFRRVSPPRRSNRSGDSYTIDGIVGDGIFHDVPPILAGVINLAGQLGIGQQRVCGSGQVFCQW